MKNRKNIVFLLLILALTTFIFSSCGGSGGGMDGSLPKGSGSVGTGSVAILLTDNYTEEFSKIIVTITRIELLSDNGKYTVFSGSRKFDFLNLRNETTLLGIEDRVPAMWYEKIRLTVADVQLYDANGDLIPEPVDLTGNHKIDLNPRQHFYVAPGQMLTIQLDLDVKNSLIKQNPNKYKFAPVVFIDIIGNLPPARIVRVPGIIHHIDDAARQFTLCPITVEGINETYHDVDSCVTVSVLRTTSIFNAATNGRPALFEDLKLRASVTAIGFFSRMSCPSNDLQSADFYDHDDDACRVLDAAVVEIGEFQKIKGTVQSEVDTTTEPYSFMLTLDPGQLPVTGDQIKVVLQDDTKLYSVKQGRLVDWRSLEPGSPVEIDGIALDSGGPDAEPDFINAVFILIDLTKKLSGVIIDMDYRNMTFGLDGVHDCVAVPEDAQIYLIKKAQSSSALIDILGLSEGMQADVYGHDSAGCFNATSIIAFEL